MLRRQACLWGFVFVAVVQSSLLLASPMGPDDWKKEPEAKAVKKLQEAMLNYSEKNNFQLPSASISKGGKPLLSWRVAILPYLGEKTLFEEFKLDEPWDSDHNQKLVEKMPAIYRSSSQENTGKTCFQVISCADDMNPATPFRLTKPISLGRIAAGDGSDFTLGIVESHPEVVWTKPEDLMLKADQSFPKLKSPRQQPYVYACMINYNMVLRLRLDLDDKKYRQAALYNDKLKHSLASLSYSD